MRSILTLCVLLLTAGCTNQRAVPDAERPSGVQVEAYYPDYERGGFTRTDRTEGLELAVTVDSVSVSSDGLLYIAGSSGLVGGPRWAGNARFLRGYESADVPEPPWAGTRSPYGHDGNRPARSRNRPLAPDAIAYISTIVLDGRFELRAPLAEVADDTLGVFYEGGASWRRPVTDLL